MAKPSTPKFTSNVTNVNSIIKDPAKFATDFLEVYDRNTKDVAMLGQNKADINEAFVVDPNINDKMISGSRQVKVELKSNTSYAPITIEELKAVTNSAGDIKEVTMTMVDPAKVEEMADRYETRGNKAKAEVLRSLIVKTVTPGTTINVRKVGSVTPTTVPTSDSTPSTTPVEKGVAVVV